jgi:hypothetical protein
MLARQIKLAGIGAQIGTYTSAGTRSAHLLIHAQVWKIQQEPLRDGDIRTTMNVYTQAGQ